MKKIAIVTYFLFPALFSRAQETSNSNYQHYADSILAGIDNTKVPYNLLYDKVQPISNLDMFALGFDSVNSSTFHFFQAVHEFHYSHFDTTGSISSTTLLGTLSAFETNHAPNEHPIGMLFASFGILKPDAVENGLINAENGVYHDVAGRTPYDTARALVFSPLSTTDYSLGNHKFFLSNQFLLGNCYKPIMKIRINFHDQRDWQELTLNGLNANLWGALPPFEADMSEEKEYLVDVELVFMDASVHHTHFTVLAQAKTTANDCNDATNGGCADCITIGGIDGGDQIPVTGDIYPNMSDYGVSSPTNATGRAYIFYANQTNYQQHKLVKPVIFIDGYDPTNTRCARNIYTKYINKHVEISPNNYVDLADHIRSLGYDLVILDFSDGGGYIEQNGMVVKKLLETLYASHQATMQKDFVLIGPSMGALVSQFALTYMEKVQVPTHVRTWISFDGPHKGANVAKGVTDLVEYLTKGNAMNIVVGQKLGYLKYSLYNNPAARQMIIHHPWAGNESPNSDTYRATFLGHLVQNQASKYPQTCRRVAVVNGSLNGTTNPFVQSCNQYSRIQLYRFGIPWNPLGVILRNAGGSISCDWSLLGTSEYGRCMNGHNFTLWPLANYAGIPAGWSNFYSQPNGQIRGLDHAPGSSFGAFTDADGESIEYKIRNIFNWYLTVNLGIHSVHFSDVGYIGKTTFVPTISAIDYLPSNDMYQNLSGLNLTSCINNTPFHIVYGNSYNTNHVAVDAHIAQAFIDEIDGKYDNCPIICTSKFTDNATAICANITSTFYLDIVPPNGTTTSWAISNNSLQILSYTNSSITVKAVGKSLSCTITATINNPCDENVVVSRILSVGGVADHLVVFSLSTNECMCTSSNSPFLPALFDYKWSGTGGNFVSDGGSNVGPSFLQSSYNSITKTVYSKVSNACETRTFQTTFVIPKTTSPCNYRILRPDFTANTVDSDIYFTDSPNPSKSNWKLTLVNDGINNVNVVLYNIYGQKLSTKYCYGSGVNSIDIDNNELPSGNYILLVESNLASKQFKLQKL